MQARPGALPSHLQRGPAAAGGTGGGGTGGAGLGGGPPGAGRCCHHWAAAGTGGAGRCAHSRCGSGHCGAAGGHGERWMRCGRRQESPIGVESRYQAVLGSRAGLLRCLASRRRLGGPSARCNLQPHLPKTHRPRAHLCKLARHHQPTPPMVQPHAHQCAPGSSTAARPAAAAAAVPARRSRAAGGSTGGGARAVCCRGLDPSLLQEVIVGGAVTAAAVSSLTLGRQASGVAVCGLCCCTWRVLVAGLQPALPSLPPGLTSLTFMPCSPPPSAAERA